MSRSDKEILTGKIFGYLTVISENNDQNDKKHSYWNCMCKCGNTCIKRADALKTTNIPSCGCHKREATSNYWSANLINKRFGKLYVTQRVDNHSVRALWECKCDCGNMVYYPSRYLLSMCVNHCGCETKSQGELEIRNILNSKHVDFKEQYSFADCLSPKGRRIKFDFAVVQNEVVVGLIEFNGQQHYEAIEFFGSEERFILQQQIDDIKRNYCKDNNIPLIEIHYKQLGKIDLNDFIKELGFV
jgi:hypothetical protein